MKRTAALLLAIGVLAGCSSIKRFSYEGSSRDEWQQPERVIAALGIAPGDRVADLGSGSGYFTWFVRLLGHITPREDLLREMAEAGYEVAEEFDFIDRQSFVIFRQARR